jgi:predicted regulator of Ras-like GTPase activity (Roadblock/LC7/MglB family)
VDAASALADLTELSSQVRGVVVLGSGGSIVASTGHPDPDRLAVAGAELWEAAGTVQRDRAVAQLEVALPHGSVFVLQSDTYGIVATTGPRPSSALVFHDLRSCLRALAERPKAKPRRRKQAVADA